MDTQTVIECHTEKGFDDTPIAAERWCEAFNRVKFCKNVTSDEVEAYTDLSDILTAYTTIENNTDQHCFVMKEKFSCLHYITLVSVVLKIDVIHNRTIMIVIADPNMILIPGFYRSYYWKQFCMRGKMISCKNLEEGHYGLLLMLLGEIKKTRDDTKRIKKIQKNHESALKNATTIHTSELPLTNTFNPTVLSTEFDLFNKYMLPLINQDDNSDLYNRTVQHNVNNWMNLLNSSIEDKPQKDNLLQHYKNTLNRRLEQEQKRRDNIIQTMEKTDTNRFMLYKNKRMGLDEQKNKLSIQLNKSTNDIESARLESDIKEIENQTNEIVKMEIEEMMLRSDWKPTDVE